MLPNNSKTNTNNNEYYPRCVNEEKTNKKSKTQISVVAKIVGAMSKRKKISSLLCFIISTYVFHSPLVLREQIYQKIQKSLIGGCGNFILSNKRNESIVKLQIRKFWKKLDKAQLTTDSIMRFAIHFDGCLQLKRNIIKLMCQQDEQQKLKLVSQNNRYYQSLFKIIQKYKKDGVINQYVIKAFSELMCRHIAIIAINNYDQYLVINSTSSYWEESNIVFQSSFNKNKIQLGVSFQNDRIKIISNQYNVYSLKDQIITRGRQTFLTSQNFREVTFNDIFIQL